MLQVLEGAWFGAAGSDHQNFSGESCTSKSKLISGVVLQLVGQRVMQVVCESREVMPSKAGDLRQLSVDGWECCLPAPV